MVTRIGVLGGIGPEATGKFYNGLIKKIQEEGLVKSNKDYPQIIINSIPAPELISAEIDEKDLDAYIQGLKELESLDVDYIVMICNTIHLYLNKLQAMIKTPIIDLRKLVGEKLSREKIRSLFLIGTPNTIGKKLYDFGNRKVFEPSEGERKALSNIIFEFNKGLEKDKNINLTKNLCLKYVQKGAECVFVGCTEFSIILNDSDFCKIDPIEIIIEFIVGNMCKR
jgi:aspartate racemase